MSTPTDQELRELDAWLCKHVTGRDDVEWNGQISWDADKTVPPRYTIDPAAAMLVLEKCLSSEALVTPIEIDRKRHKAGRFRLEAGPLSNPIIGIEDTLPLAICRFAKVLFSK